MKTQTLLNAPKHYEIAVCLLDIKTKTRAIFHYDHDMTQDYEPGIFNAYSWQEGNYSCDCNRHLFFERARRKDPNWQPNEGAPYPCNNDLNRRYVIEKIVRVSDGEIVYSEIK